MRSQTKAGKNGDKQLAPTKRDVECKSHVAVDGKRIKFSKPESPNSTTFVNDELIARRHRNKMLTDALKAVDRESKEKIETSYGVVWYARNRSE